MALLTLLGALYGNDLVAAEGSKQIFYKKPLTVGAQHCLREMLKSGGWRHSPDFGNDMMSVAVFAQADLDGPTKKFFIYVMNDFSFCGTAGCSMLIGKVGKNGLCREIYNDSGYEVAITILPKKDHGYRRLLTPCEVRFDGREYRKIHDECPNANVQR